LPATHHRCPREMAGKSSQREVVIAVMHTRTRCQPIMSDATLHGSSMSIDACAPPVRSVGTHHVPARAHRVQQLAVTYTHGSCTRDRHPASRWCPGVPSSLNDLPARGVIDVALASSIEYARHSTRRGPPRTACQRAEVKDLGADAPPPVSVSSRSAMTPSRSAAPRPPARVSADTQSGLPARAGWLA